MLSPYQLKAREGRLTASAVACLMEGDNQKIHALWQRLISGEPEEDLSDVWPVQLGSCTEQLNLDWFEKRTGKKVTRRGEVVIHPEYDWAACTLDGWVGFVIEAKHVGGREPLEKVIARYQPQLHWQMIVTGARKAALSIIEGTNPPIVEYIDFDEAYAAELWSRACAFMLCVQTLTPPVPVEPVTPRKR